MRPGEAKRELEKLLNEHMAPLQVDFESAMASLDKVESENLRLIDKLSASDALLRRYLDSHGEDCACARCNDTRAHLGAGEACTCPPPERDAGTCPACVRAAAIQASDGMDNGAEDFTHWQRASPGASGGGGK